MTETLVVGLIVVTLVQVFTALAVVILLKESQE